MSTLKVNEVRHLSNSGSANIVLESNATTNLQATSTLGLTVTGTLTVSGVSTFNGNTVVGNASTDTIVLNSTVSGFNNFSGFTGEVRMYAGDAAGTSPPAGWLYCNGDTISSTINDGGTNLGGTHYNADGKGNDYQPLFNLLKASSDWGNTTSASWGTDKVFVPDFRSRSPVGIATGAANMADGRVSGGVTTNTGTALAAGLTSRTLSIAAGTETHTLTIAELAAHTHASSIVSSATGQTINNPTHTHGMQSHTHTGASHSHSGSPLGTSNPGTHTHWSGEYDKAVRDGTGDNVTAMYVDTYNAGDLDVVNVGALTANGSHTHSITGSTASTAAGAGSGPNNNTTTATAPSITLTDPNHTHTLTAASTGSGTAHTNLSPIIAVNYIIKV